MGDPRKQRKKYSTPRHPWIKDRIDEENKLLKEYGLRNKKEVYKAESELKRYTSAAKRITKLGEDKQALQEAKEIIARLKKYGILTEEQGFEDILKLDVTKFLDRRLQTVVFRLGLALTAKQARQVIVHGHIQVNGRKIDAPAHIISLDDEITYVEKSSFASEEHPERAKKTAKDKKELQEIVEDKAPEEAAA